MSQPVCFVYRLLPAGAVILSLALAVGACAPHIDHHVRLDRHLSQGDFDAALAVLRRHHTHYPAGDAALYFMEEGLLCHYAGRYEESNRSLLQAEAILDELYTRSVFRQTASWWINDNAVPYRGEHFEDALVNLFLALNYASLGLHDDALVEARQVDIELAQPDDRFEPNSPALFREDAFIRFIMGVLYESDGQLDDAFIAYRKAETVYRKAYQPNYGVAPPAVLLQKLSNAADQLGFEGEILQINRYYPGIAARPWGPPFDSAEIFLLHYNGPGPEKIETFWSVPMPDGYVVKLAYPRLRLRDYAIEHSRMRLRHHGSGQEYRVETELVEPLGAIAAANLEHRIESVKTKAVARATAKYLATQAVAAAVREESGDSAGALVQLLGNLLAVSTENADVRHWRLLPDEIRVGRAAVPAGGYEGHIEFGDHRGATVVSQTVAPFRVSAGEKKFILRRTLQ